MTEVYNLKVVSQGRSPVANPSHESPRISRRLFYVSLAATSSRIAVSPSARSATNVTSSDLATPEDGRL